MLNQPYFVAKNVVSIRHQSFKTELTKIFFDKVQSMHCQSHRVELQLEQEFKDVLNMYST